MNPKPFILFDEVTTGDLFTAEYTQTELWMYPILEKRERFGCYAYGTDLEEKKRMAVRQSVMIIMHRMLSTRTNRNVINHLSQNHVWAIHAAEAKVSSCLSKTHYCVFLIHVLAEVLPALWAVRPGKKSIYHKNYEVRYYAMRDFLTEEVKRVRALSREKE